MIQSAKVQIRMEVLVLLLLKILSIQADIDRRDGATNIFSVINYGRMYSFNIIMFLEKISLYECANYCIMHLQCHSVSYSSTEQLCELNDIEFDGFEADTDATGWMNYGTPPKVDGGFSHWTNVTGCSKSCGHGHMTYIRSCDNPKPQHGGASCVGDTRKTEPCHTRICPVCYGARTGEHGKFTVPKTGSTKAIHLTHISGGLKCDTTYRESKWGCSYIIHALKSKDAFVTYVTDDSKNVLFPQFTKTFYNIDGKSIYDAELTLRRSTSINVVKGQTLRMYYGEDLFNIHPSDNSGNQCIYVKIIYD